MLLLIEDKRAAVSLLKEALKEACKEYPVPVQLYMVTDGRTDLAFLHHEGRYQHAPRPDLSVLDFHLPGPSGHKVLAQVKSEAALKCIPVVVFTSSTAPEDIAHSDALGANAYVYKAAELEEFFATSKDLVGFWCQRAALPAATAVSSGRSLARRGNGELFAVTTRKRTASNRLTAVLLACVRTGPTFAQRPLPHNALDSHDSSELLALPTTAALLGC